MKIYKAINQIMLEVEPIKKSKTNQQQNYKFRGIDDVYLAVNALFAKYGVFSTIEILSDQRFEKPTRNGGILTTTILKIKYDFFADDGSKVSCVVVGEGMDSGDKSSNKAMSVAHKYAILQLLCIPTDEPKDPEHESPEPVYRANTAQQHKAPPPQQKSAPKQDPSKVTEAQIKRLYAIAGQNGFTNEQIKEFLQGQYNLQSSRDIKKADYEMICKFFEQDNKDDIPNFEESLEF